MSVSIVEPVLTDQGCASVTFPALIATPSTARPICARLYTRADPHFTGRATVPVLWDRKTGTIVNNESADIVRMLNSGFCMLADNRIDLYPEALRTEIDAWNERIYPSLNNGVCRAGFATTQAAYEEAFHGVFSMLDELEQHLATRQYPEGTGTLRHGQTMVFTTLMLLQVFNVFSARSADRSAFEDAFTNP